MMATPKQGRLLADRQFPRTAAHAPLATARTPCCLAGCRVPLCRGFPPDACRLLAVQSVCGLAE